MNRPYSRGRLATRFSLERRVDPRQRLVKHRRLGGLRPGQLRLFRDRDLARPTCDD
jgi:hypothetical protein